MQSASWYLRRLRAMSAAEVTWRACDVAYGVADRFLLRARARRRRTGALFSGGSDDGLAGYRVTPVDVGQWSAATATGIERLWRETLLARAEKAASGALEIFDQRNCRIVEPTDWNRNPKTGTLCPMRFARWLDYRDFDLVGDAKFVWEPNRHHHLVLLGRAYRATGDARYAMAALRQIASWLEGCPYGVGINWRSPLELAIRLINWIWTIDLIGPSGLLVGELREQLLRSIHLHVCEISRRYSRGSSANNHLIGEAAGVFVAASYLQGMDGARSRQNESYRILCREILNQTHPDGGTCEQAMGYHLFVTQLLLTAGLVGRWSGKRFPVQYWRRLEKMFEFLAAMSEGGHALPMFGDSDDGYVLDLSDGKPDARTLLAIGAVLFGRKDFAAVAGDCPEAVEWLFGSAGVERFAALVGASIEEPICSRAFQDSGYYLLQCEDGLGGGRISVVFDCGPFGFGSIAAHAHADALSFTMRAFGEDVFVDPGTYDYFSYPRWRDYFRSTRAHNTIVIDGRDQSEMSGPFLWGAKAEARCAQWQPDRWGGRVVGEHYGYTRLAEPVVHRRTVVLDGRSGQITVRDEIRSGGSHDVALHFHLAEQCRLTKVGSYAYEIDFGPGSCILRLDSRLRVQVLRGSEDPVAGWVSRRYHQKSSAYTVIGRCRCHENVTLTTRICIKRR